jgi:hypothetical protein
VQGKERLHSLVYVMFTFGVKATDLWFILMCNHHKFALSTDVRLFVSLDLCIKNVFHSLYTLQFWCFLCCFSSIWGLCASEPLLTCSVENRTFHAGSIPTITLHL